jgi:sorbitol-6-phosphate 2-dehydrogenase
MNGLLQDKKALVTGGGQGLGEAISLRLAREGCDVAIGDVNESGAQETAKGIVEQFGRDSFALKTDVTRDEEVAALFDTAAERFGRIDIVVSNAAILIAEPIDSGDPRKWHKVMEVNLFGYYLTTRHAARIMKPQGSGSIIQINSKSGKKGSAKNSAYAASKFGGVGHTQSVALELAEHGVRCNAILPGNLLDSPLWTESLFKQYARNQGISEAEVRQKYIDQVPMKRGCRYEDVTNVVVFLASDMSSYMTGQAINVTGGQEMR